MRALLLVIHRWLGIVAAVVLVAVGLTGAILVYARIPSVTDLHTGLGLGAPGLWLVNAATVAAWLLVLGGVVLWWRRKIVAIDVSKGAWRLLFDLHHALGIIGGALMLLIALSGTGLMMTEYIGARLGLAADDPDYPTRAEVVTRRLIHVAHTGGSINGVVKMVWALGSLAVVVQAVSGFWVWWKPRRRPDG
jgi:uncharacterized iron-regulated membrane protein